MSDETAPTAPVTPPVPDEHQLRLLSIFHYVLGALELAFSCVPLLYFLGGFIWATVGSAQTSELTPAVVGVVTMILGAALTLLTWTKGICTLLAGRYLAERRHYGFCMVVAAVSCLSVPFGTLLGAFTLIALSRDSVRAQFTTGS